MDIRTCKRCNKLFRYCGNSKCPDCILELDRQFVQVKTMLYDNPNCSREELCEETGVDEEDLLRWLREGRLTLGDDSNIALKCHVCGVNINSGRFCESCKHSMVEKLEKSANSMIKENPNISRRNYDNNNRDRVDTNTRDRVDNSNNRNRSENTAKSRTDSKDKGRSRMYSRGEK